MKVRPTVLSMIFILSLKIVGYSFADSWLQTQMIVRFTDFLVHKSLFTKGF